MGLLVLIYLIEEKDFGTERVLQKSVFYAAGFVSGGFYDFLGDFQKCADTVWLY